jgi:hypothetical protein
MAFMIRYAGITFVASFGIVMATWWLLRRTLSTWWDAVIAMILPVACVAALFLRNYFLVGSVTGGPSLEHGSSMVQVLLSMRWSIEQMIGIYDSRGRWLCVIMVIALSWITVVGLRNARRVKDEVVGSSGIVQVLTLSGLYVVITVLLYGYLAYQRQPEMITARYLLPVLPFIIITACCVFSALKRSVLPMRTLVSVLAGMSFVAFLAVQVIAMTHWEGWLRNDTKFAVMIAGMNEHVGSSTVRDIVHTTAQSGSVLAVDGQLLGMWLDLPTVGLTESSWTRRTWTADEVLTLVRQFDVRVVCAFPSLFDESAEINQHRQFFIDLERGEIPEWLTLIAQTPLVSVYGVLPASGSES